MLFTVSPCSGGKTGSFALTSYDLKVGTMSHMSSAPNSVNKEGSGKGP